MFVAVVVPEDVVKVGDVFQDQLKEDETFVPT
jgi:hypothetical protein